MAYLATPGANQLTLTQRILGLSTANKTNSQVAAKKSPRQDFLFGEGGRVVNLIHENGYIKYKSSKAGTGMAVSAYTSACNARETFKQMINFEKYNLRILAETKNKNHLKLEKRNVRRCSLCPFVRV